MEWFHIVIACVTAKRYVSLNFSVKIVMSSVFVLARSSSDAGS